MRKLIVNLIFQISTSSKFIFYALYYSHLAHVSRAYQLSCHIVFIYVKLFLFTFAKK